MAGQENIIFIKSDIGDWDSDEYPTEFEEVHTEDITSGISTYRVRVPGGFLTVTRDGNTRESKIAFIEEPTSNWETP